MYYLTLLLMLSCFMATLQGLPKECVKSYHNIILECAKPFRIQVTQSEADCRRLCIQNQAIALSCQFDAHSSECSLFDIASPLDGSPDTLHSSAKGRRGRNVVKRFVGDEILGLGLKKEQYSNNDCEPSIVPSIGRILIVPDRSCALPSTVLNDLPMAKEGFPKLRNVFDTRYSAAKIASVIQPVGLALNNNSSNFAPFRVKNGIQPITKGKRAEKHSDCLPKFSLRFEIVQGIEVQSSPLISFAAETPDTCLYACRNNQANGTRLRTMCRSAQFDRVQQRCTFFDNSITPSGSAQYEPNKNIMYFEKVCLPESLSGRCSGSLRRIPQYVLIGHATAIVDALTHSACIEMCMRASEELGFECKSAIHFYEYPALNCILNIHSARTRPNFFGPELKQKVDYIEMNDCQQSDTLQPAKASDNLDEFIEMADHLPSPPTNDQILPKVCNPLDICCPLPLPDGTDDCAHGFRILKDGSRLDCLPEVCT